MKSATRGVISGLESTKNHFSARSPPRPREEEVYGEEHGVPSPLSTPRCLRRLGIDVFSVWPSVPLAPNLVDATVYDVMSATPTSTDIEYDVHMLQDET